MSMNGNSVISSKSLYEETIVSHKINKSQTRMITTGDKTNTTVSDYNDALKYGRMLIQPYFE